jgi:hypothetical protein
MTLVAWRRGTVILLVHTQQQYWPNLVIQMPRADAFVASLLFATRVTKKRIIETNKPLVLFMRDEKETMKTMRTSNPTRRCPTTNMKLVKTSSGKRVTWSPTEASVDVFDDYTNLPTEVVWYTGQELNEIRKENEYLVAFANSKSGNREDESGDNDYNSLLRGLESWSEQGSWERFQNIRDYQNKVFDEQDRQRGIERSNCEYNHAPAPLVKRVNHLHIPFDHKRLAALCRDVTASARRTAMVRAKRDEKAAQQVFAEMEEEQEEQEPLTKEDDATAATEYDSSLSSISVEDAEEEDYSATSSPSASWRSDSTRSLESLRQEKERRFANYLAKRQQRISQRDFAAQAREERRQERKAMIRFEADRNIAQLQRVVGLACEMRDMVLIARESRGVV